MTHINVFLNTSVQQACCLEQIANVCLTPVRYLWRGHTVSNPNILFSETHRVLSFHEDGANHCSRTEPSLHASSRGVMKTALAILCLIPGFIVGVILKGLSYLSADVRTRHRWVKVTMTPRDFVLFQNEPNPTFDKLQGEVNNLSNFTWVCHPIRAVVIHGHGVLNMGQRGPLEEDGSGEGQQLVKQLMMLLNPGKIIFDRVVGVTPPHSGMFATPAEQQILDKWERNLRIPERTIQTRRMATVEEAMRDPLPNRPGTSKPYHAFYLI